MGRDTENRRKEGRKGKVEWKGRSEETKGIIKRKR